MFVTKFSSICVHLGAALGSLMFETFSFVGWKSYQDINALTCFYLIARVNM
jgi:hypothetical protein